MNHILLDIKKFLKNLQNGQLEIEAGQWELHKDINKLKKTIREFKRLQKDVYFMKKHGLKQMDLIKQLQANFNGSVVEKNNDSSLTTSCNKKEGNILVHEKRVSKSKNEKKMLKNKQPEQKRSCNSQSYQKLGLQEVQKISKSSSFDRGILQRYLNDSVKYINKDAVKNGISNNWLSLKPVVHTGKIGSKNDYNSFKIEKQSTASSEKKETSSFLKKSGKKRYKKTMSLLSCRGCEKKFFCKNYLKKHNKIHKKMTQFFKGFKCSYCDEICRSPETLTVHLRRCRIITKTQNEIP